MFDSNSNTYTIIDEANDSLLEDLQLPSIYDLLAETTTSETNIDLYSSDTQTVTLAQSSDSLELESAELSNLGNNFNDNFRIGSSTVTDLSTIALLPTTNAGFTGNTYVDGILWGGNRWNTGASKQIDYSFWNSGTESFDDSYDNIATNAYTWTAAEKASMVEALDTWAAVADITFVNVGDNNANATLGFYNVDNSQLGQGVLGRFSPPGTNGEGIGYFNWEGEGWDYINGNQQGDFGFITLIHELGHGLGLAHPHDNGGGSSVYPGVTSSSDTGDFGLNQGIYTTMSYNDGVTAIVDHGSLNYGYQGTPMAFDIAAIQHLYGANMNHNTGNDTYFLPTVNASGTSFSSIWDAGGTDKISGAGASSGVEINLNDATLNISDGAGAGGYLSAVTGIFGGFTIANGVIIENADGSDFDDSLIGNEFNNSLFGEDGNDTLLGGAGNDYLDGWNGNDSLYGEAGNDTLLGYYGNDYLSGGSGDDSLYGEANNDTLTGGSGNDRLVGYSSGTEYDTLTGGTGTDTFVLGDSSEVFYQGNGYATITDFNWLYDYIEVQGTSSEYSLGFGNLIGGSAQDTAIFYDGDAIGVVQDYTNVNINRDFVFV
ncbi:MAG: matrixin family metalloprotease [Xenococcaceae cyanobacterium MO_207.B15]|nr:matrixin family metalloprotease [Xenococcaceae cyanobacterium MO_207.B15]